MSTSDLDRERSHRRNGHLADAYAHRIRCCFEPLLLRTLRGVKRKSEARCRATDRGALSEAVALRRDGRRECDRRVECVRAIGNDEVALLTPPVRLGPLRLRHREFELEKRVRSACNG
jgi:hypothetical protein